MATKDKKIDQYIVKAQPFAQPILRHLRELVHKTCPEVEEKMKWSFPHFDYKGQMMCSMASFKQHAAFGFWKTSLIKDPKKILSNTEGMGSLGKITSVKDLPSDTVLTGFIKQAMKLNEEGTTVAKPKPKKVEFEMPEDLTKALKKNKAAQIVFDGFSPSNKRDYATWISDAKSEATRKKRLDTAIEWMSEGKIRNWKYVK
jgi:uncharacterized protein YdeI (YjbR/CyaY-like superfamily)